MKGPLLTQFKLQSVTEPEVHVLVVQKIAQTAIQQFVRSKVKFLSRNCDPGWIQWIGHAYLSLYNPPLCSIFIFGKAIVFYPTYRKPCIELRLTRQQSLRFMHKRVLIADDSPGVRDVIRTFLRGHEEIEICGEAEDGLETLEKAQRLKPDLILLDLIMPEINGAEVASILKHKMPDVRIILFTMYSENVGKYLSSAIGVDAVLSKPDGMSHIVESIESLFPS